MIVFAGQDGRIGFAEPVDVLICYGCKRFLVHFVADYDGHTGRDIILHVYEQC